MIIACDIDGVLLDLMPQWVKMYNEDYNDNLTPADILGWSVHKYIKKECGRKIYDYIEKPEVFEQSLPIPHSLNCIENLCYAGHKVVYVTANNPFDVKTKWLEKHDYPFSIDDLIVCRDKSYIHCDFMVDDYIKNVETSRGTGILFTQQHNKQYDWSPRANDWHEVLRIIYGKEAEW